MTFSADFSFMGMANTYDVCIHIVVKTHHCPLDGTGAQHIVSITSSAIRTQGISRCCCGYLAIVSKFLARVLHLFSCLTISWYNLGYQ